MNASTRWCTCILLATLALASASPAVQNGFFSARSGNAVLKPLDFQGEASVIFVDGNQYIQSTSVPSSISLPTIADVIARSVGVDPINPYFTPSFVNTDTFNVARANIMVSVPASKQNLKDADASSILVAGSIVDTTDLSYPVEPVSLLTTATTGQQPSVHGIVNKEFYVGPQQSEAAYSSSASQRRISNVADIVSQSFMGQSLIVSSAAKQFMAAATCTGVTSAANSNSFCVSFQSQANVMASLSTNDVAQAFTFSVADLASTLSGASSCLKDMKQVNVETALNLISVEVQGKPVVFDLNSQETLSFFGELQYLSQFASLLSQSSVSSLVQDNTPDMFSFHFSGLQSMLDNNQISVDSAHYKAALLLIDAIVPKAINEIMSVYNGHVLAEIILTGSPMTSQQLQLQQQAQLMFPGQAWPLIQLANGFTCKNLPPVAGFEVECYQSVSTSSFLEVMADSSSTSTPSSEDIAKYQIVLWLVIGLVFILIAAVYSLGNMHIKKDSLVYSSFNPNWEGKRK